MCKCTPGIRTPYCGRGQCVWPNSKPSNVRESLETIESVIIERCESCGEALAEELHTCPYREDINGDSVNLCNCCGTCERTCAADI